MNMATAQYKQHSDTLDREQLILDNIEYVRQVFSTLAVHVSNEDDRENLYSAGVVGLVQAANSFDPRKGRFRTFAFNRIRGAIIDELRRIAPVSQDRLKLIGIIKKTMERLEPPVTPEMLAVETGLTLEQVEETLEAMRFIKPQDWSDLHGAVHSSWRAEPDSPEHAAELAETKELLADGIESLKEQQRIVITLYYSEGLTLAEIGEVIGRSESRVSRILETARFNLREYIRAQTR